MGRGRDGEGLDCTGRLGGKQGAAGREGAEVTGHGGPEPAEELGGWRGAGAVCQPY